MTSVLSGLKEKASRCPHAPIYAIAVSVSAVVSFAVSPKKTWSIAVSSAQPYLSVAPGRE